jgi:hypothetical protein
VLAKVSNTDFDTAWVTPSGGGGGSGIKTTATINVPHLSFEHEQTVTFTGCTPTTAVVATVAPHLDTDENGPEGIDVIALVATPGTNNAFVKINFREQASGPVRIQLIGI